MSSYNNDITKTFSFDELYEGQVVKVNDDNSCYINVFKFFVTNKSVSDVYKADISVNSSNIENLNGSFNITKLNSIICKPFKLNSGHRKMNIGDNVLVMFLNGDPQRPYYIDAYLPSSVQATSGDVIFNNNNISITTEISDNNPKLIIKLQDTVFEIDKDTKLGKVTENTVVQEKPGDTVIIEGTPGEIDGNLLKNYIELNSVRREFDNLKDKYSVIMSVSDHYNISNEDRQPIIDSYNTLVELVEPILENIGAVEVDVDILNETFLNYHKNYNSMLGEFLKMRGLGGSGLTKPLPEVTDENLESVIRDMIYVVNTKTSKKFIKDIIEDGIFSVEEKKLLSTEIIKINNEKQVLDLLAPLHYGENSVERFHLQYREKYDELNEYISPMMVEYDEDTTIIKDEFFNKFMEYFKQRTVLYTELFDYSVDLYTERKPEFDKYAADSILNASEKKKLKEFLNIYKEEKTPFESLCNIYGVNIKNYLGVYGIIESEFGKLNDDDEQRIDKSEFMKNFQRFVDVRNNLLETIIAISEAYIDTIIEGISIGGTNLIHNSSFLYETKEWSFPGFDTNFIVQVLDDEGFEKFLYTDCLKIKASLTPTFFKCKNGDYLVLTLFLRTRELTKLTFTINDSKNESLSMPYTIEAIPSEDFKRYIIPLTIIKDPKDLTLANKPSLLIENPLGKSIDLTKNKLEFGTIDSDWSPAPEDRKYEEENFKSIIHEMSSAIIQTTEKIQLTVDSFYSKVTETMEEFRKQNASVTVELGSIDLNLSDLYQKKEQIVENLGGMQVITDTLTTHDRLNKLQLDFEGMHLTVRDIVSTVTNIAGTIDGVLAEGGRIDTISGSLLDYHNDLKGMGGVLKRIEGRMETYTKYIDGVKESISKIEEIDQATLTMKGSLNKIESSLGHITGSNMLDMEFDENGNIVRSKYLDKLNSEFSGVITKLGSVETIAKEASEEVERHRELIGDFTQEDTKVSLLERISKLTVATDSITANVSKLDANINTFEELKATDFLNNFSWTHNLNKWSPTGELIFDEEGNLEVNSAINVLCLEKYTQDWYFGILSTQPENNALIQSDMFKIDPYAMYKFSIAIKDHPYNTDGKWRLGMRFYNENLLRIPGYLNNTKVLTNDLWFDDFSESIVPMFRFQTGYIYPCKEDYKNSELMIKGTSKNCLRFNEDALYASLIIEYTTERGNPVLYIDNPEMFEVKSIQSEQLKLLQNALIAVEPDNIAMVVQNHKFYQDDMDSLKKYTDAAFDITSESIDQIIRDTTVLDSNGNEVKIKDAFNTVSSNVDGTTQTVAKIEKELAGMRDNLNLTSGLTIMGSNIFRLSKDKVITPQSITLYAHIKDLLGVVDDLDSIELEWYIDGERKIDEVDLDTRSMTVSSRELNTKGSIKIVVKNKEETLYDEYTIIKLEEGSDAVNMVLSNEFIGLPASSDGVVTDYSKASTGIDIYEGTTLSNEKWLLEIDNNEEETGIVGNLVNTTYKILSASKDVSSVKIKATKMIGEEVKEISKSLQVAKMRQGESGIQGNDAYNVILSNENQSIPVKSNMEVFESNSYFTDVRVYRGNDEVQDIEIVIDNDIIPDNFECTIFNDTTIKSVEFKTLANKPMKFREGMIPIKVKLTDPATKRTMILNKDFTWTCSIQGQSAQTVDLVADSYIFKSDDGGKTYSPKDIVVNAIFKNCKFDSWYISSGKKTNYIKYDSKIHKGIVTTPEYIKVSSDSNVFTDEITSVSFKIFSNVENMYDTVTISKLYDRSDINDIAEKATVAYSFIEQNADRITSAVTKNEFDEFKTDLNTNQELLQKGLNKWGYDVYDTFREDRDAGMEAIVGVAPSKMDVVDDNSLILLPGYEDKMIRFYTSVYVEKPCSIDTKIRMFNSGTLYVNTVRVVEKLDSTTSASFKLNFSTGWNIIEIIAKAGTNAGFLIDEILSDNAKINTMNAYAILNDYSKAKYTYSEIEQTTDSIKSTVAALGKDLDDVYSVIEQTKDEWKATFVDKGYKNYVDNGDFFTQKIEGWEENYYTPVGYNRGNMADEAEIRYVSERSKMWTANEDALEIYVKGLKAGSFGAAYHITGLTIGETYTLCAEVAGHDSDKSIIIADNNWGRYETAYLGHLSGGYEINGWNRLAIKFVANEESANIAFRINKNLSSQRPGYFWIKRVGVYVGKGWRPFMRSGNEVYAGEVTIDMNGVRVDHSATNTATRLDSQGMHILSKKNNMESLIAWFGGEGGKSAYIPRLSADIVMAKNIPGITQDTYTKYYVNPHIVGNKNYVRGASTFNPFSSINEALESIKENLDGMNSTAYLDRPVVIDIADATYGEKVNITGFNDAGNGSLTLNLGNNVKFIETFSIQGNSCDILVISPSNTNINSHPRPLITVKGKDAMYIARNSKTVKIKGLCVEGNNSGGKSGIVVDNSRVYLQSIDFSYFIYCIKGKSADIFTHALRGSFVKYYAYLGEGSIVYRSYSIPKSEFDTIKDSVSASATYNIDSIQKINSAHNVPPPDPVPPPPPKPVTQRVTQTFSPSRYYSTRSYTSEGEYIQGAWTSDGPSYGWWTGHASFGSAVKNFCSGGSDITMKLYMERLNTAHGYYAATKVILNSGAEPGVYLTQGEGKWFDVPKSVRDSLAGGSELTSYTNSISNYIRYRTNMRLEVSCTKPI